MTATFVTRDIQKGNVTGQQLGISSSKPLVWLYAAPWLEQDSSAQLVLRCIPPRPLPCCISEMDRLMTCEKT